MEQQALFTRLLGDIASPEAGADITLGERLTALELQQGQFKQQVEDLIGTTTELEALLMNITNTQVDPNPFNRHLYSLLNNLRREGAELPVLAENSSGEGHLSWLRRVNYLVQSLPSISSEGARLSKIQMEMEAIVGFRGEYRDGQQAVSETLFLLSTLEDLTKSALL